MKKACLLGFLAIFLGTFQAQSQKTVELSPFWGYTFSGSTDIYTYGGFPVNYDVKDGMSYGATLGMEVTYLVQAELSYTRVDTRLVRTGNLDRSTFDVGMEYYQIGGVKEIELDGPDTKAFGKLSLGANRYWNKDEDFGSNWMFSAVFGLGVKKFFSDHVGIKIYSNLNLPMEFGGVGFFVGTGGIDGGASFYVPMLHWDVGGALILRMN
jgi:hypothetical protein